MLSASPRRIGRYEIVGRLATGGMAEVLLARVRGPHDFERPVVIKRILPHLALEPTIVELFLDEARIVANLRHPNLIHIHELGREGDELFMVMEFLEGESVSGLCRRLALRDEHLSFDLAAHIVAEACAGLHAAHEAKSADGRPLGIVHRDVSPQNIFVTYSGSVHVIDFGIAMAADRVTRTEAGTVRGKFEYMAPEQIEGLRVDRRADVFSLGVVLLELASGRRVFRRAGHAGAVMAIMSAPAPKLSALRDGAPLRLEEICVRALSRTKQARYQTSSDLRRDLLGFTRKRSDDDLGEQLGRVMHDLFGDRVAEKAELLRQVRRGADVETMPAAEVDAQVEPHDALRPSSTTATASHTAREHPRARWRILPLTGIAVVVLACAMTLAWRMSSRASERSGASTSVAESLPGKHVPSAPMGSASDAPSSDGPPHAAALTGSGGAPSAGPTRPASSPARKATPPRRTGAPAPTLW